MRPLQWEDVKLLRLPQMTFIIHSIDYSFMAHDPEAHPGNANSSDEPYDKKKKTTQVVSS